VAEALAERDSGHPSRPVRRVSAAGLSRLAPLHSLNCHWRYNA